MSKPRKKYRPRGVNPLSYLAAMQGATLLTLDDRLRWAMQLDEAITAIATAKADKTAWVTIIDAVNTVEQLILDGKAQDPDGIIEAAQKACVDIGSRTTKAVRASELAALRDLAAAWSEIMAGITHAERFAADMRVAQRVARALKTNDPSTIIISQ